VVFLWQPSIRLTLITIGCMGFLMSPVVLNRCIFHAIGEVALLLGRRTREVGGIVRFERWVCGRLNRRS